MAIASTALLNITDATSQRGILFLEQLLVALTAEKRPPC